MLFYRVVRVPNAKSIVFFSATKSCKNSFAQIICKTSFFPWCDNEYSGTRLKYRPRGRGTGNFFFHRKIPQTGTIRSGECFLMTPQNFVHLSVRPCTCLLNLAGKLVSHDAATRHRDVLVRRPIPHQNQQENDHDRLQSSKHIYTIAPLKKPRSFSFLGFF